MCLSAVPSWTAVHPPAQQSSNGTSAAIEKQNPYGSPRPLWKGGHELSSNFHAEIIHSEAVVLLWDVLCVMTTCGVRMACTSERLAAVPNGGTMCCCFSICRCSLLQRTTKLTFLFIQPSLCQNHKNLLGQTAAFHTGCELRQQNAFIAASGQPAPQNPCASGLEPVCWWAQTSPALHGLHFQRTYLAGEPHHDSSLFKVGLPIEVGSFQVTDPVLIRGVQQQDISWDGLVTLQLHKIPHSDIFPAFLNVSTFFPVTLKTCYRLIATLGRQASWSVGLQKK